VIRRTFVLIAGVLLGIAVYGKLLTFANAYPSPFSRPTLVAVTNSEQTLAQFCQEIDAAWQGKDWPDVISDLQAVRALGGQCAGQDPAAKFYPAYYNYGAALEAAGDLSDAVDAYRQALSYNPDGREAELALIQQGALTPEPLSTCTAQQIAAAQGSIPAYQPAGSGGFVTTNGTGFIVNGAPLVVRGVNYYPAQAPWRHFLTDSTPDQFAHDLDLIRAEGLNTIRIFLWYGGLFQCPGSGIVPNLAAFARVDALLQAAAARGLRVLVTLNDLPDLFQHPLYTKPDLPAVQTDFIVTRYLAEPAILAWDLRNEGDVDYVRGYASRTDVSAWLTRMAVDVRAHDRNHLITAGWNEDNALTVDHVDFVSLHHWTTADALHNRVVGLRAMTSKPILVEEIGYSTATTGETNQANYLQEALQTAEADQVAGWIIWQAFDTRPEWACNPPDCPGTDSAEYYFGLWHTDGSPKPAAQALQSLLQNLNNASPTPVPN
jgi:tetratricopeptide (TPR) repeat protein